MNETWHYAELELRYAAGHERPIRIRWSPPDPAESLEHGRPNEPDPLTTMTAALGGLSGVDPETLFEIHLLNAIGAMGWQLAHAPQRDAGTPERLRYLFTRKSNDESVYSLHRHRYVTVVRHTCLGRHSGLGLDSLQQGQRRLSRVIRP